MVELEVSFTTTAVYVALLQPATEIRAGEASSAFPMKSLTRGISDFQLKVSLWHNKNEIIEKN